MDTRVLGSDGSTIPGHHTNSLLVNGSLLIDAGTVTSILTLEEQAAVTDVVITHAHLDHVVDLAFLVDNGFARRRTSFRVWAPQQVLDTLHSHLFNDLIWPDFTRILSADLAVASGHMTLAMLKTELTKLGRDDVPINVFHMKLQFLDEILEELNNLEVRQLQILQGGEFFSF